LLLRLVPISITRILVAFDSSDIPKKATELVVHLVFKVDTELYFVHEGAKRRRGALPRLFCRVNEYLFHRVIIGRERKVAPRKTSFLGLSFLR